MKILWLTNTILPYIAENIGWKKPVCEGWLTGLSDELLKKDQIRLTVCFPQSKSKRIIYGSTDKLEYYGFFVKKEKNIIYDKHLEKVFKYLLNKIQPDIIHVMGTEYPHTLSMINACKKKGLIKKTIISIQGLISEYAKVYCTGIPSSILKRQTIRDYIRRDNIWKQKEQFEKRGSYEIKALKKAKNVIGRTEWDKKCCISINPNINYFVNNETLRKEFYDQKWNASEYEPGRIFVSQGYYPIKGLHTLLKVLPDIHQQFSNTHLYISGINIFDKPHWKYSSYEKYIYSLIMKNDLYDHVTFLGTLQPDKMCQQFLKANIFILPSIIENSPNSLGEAMLIGTPCIAAKVGGVESMINQEEGLLYESGNTKKLTSYICRLLNDPELCCSLSKKARKHARITHDGNINLNKLLYIYQKLAGGSLL